MTNAGTLKVTTPSDREIAMTRVFEEAVGSRSQNGRNPGEP
jgi:hypothetical protein